MYNLKTILFFLLLSTMAIGQTGVVLDARNNLATGNLEKAKDLIDDAIKNADLRGDYHTWYWRGYIYKDLYKKVDREKKNVDSEYRKTSILAFKECLNYKDKLSEDTLASVKKILKYLSSTVYNDAVISLDTVNYKLAIKNYQLYKETATLHDKDKDFRVSDIKFKLKLATVYVSLYESHTGTPKANEYFDMAKQEYAEIIRIDGQHLSANYNLGILFYNKAVNIIKNMDVGTDLEELAKQEDVCVELFLMALPYVKKAYELDPQRRETLIGLTGIYYSLNDLEQYQKYKDKLSSLD